MGTVGSFPRVKRPGRETDHSPPNSAEIKKTWIYTTFFFSSLTLPQLLVLLNEKMVRMVNWENYGKK
jgi:hypothetical protein